MNANLRRIGILFLAGPLALVGFGTSEASASAVSGAVLPARHLVAAQLGIIINEKDPLSVAIGEYYRDKRKIPGGNIIRIRLDPERTTLGAGEFSTVRAAIERQTPPQVQAYALTWVRPYRVECMSITTAIAAGFDSAFCGEGCSTSRVSSYFNSNSRAPFTDLHLRPTMSLAAINIVQAKALIDRGVAADGSAPQGSAYLVETTDAARNVRARLYADARTLAGRMIPVERLDAGQMQGRTDVMFYFTGAVEVPHLATNRFLPGAVGDHLTSFGGDLLGTKQMSSLRWLEAGATGSYGTVTEPCNITGKFPNPGLMMHHYLAGETLIEAYWKSVAMPGQGLFIGEPLAAPYRKMGSN